MKLFVAQNKKQGDKKAFEIIKAQVLKKPGSLIGLAVGKTTDGLYKLISKDVLKSEKKWKQIKLFQIDENLGAPPNSPLSFNYEIRKELKSLLKTLYPENIFLIDGLKNPRTIIKKGYKFIKENKGIDLIILGIGPEYDPHIAYNTSGISLIDSRFRTVKLHPKILEKLNRRNGGSAKRRKIKEGITIGIKDILETKKALLIAYGKEKAKSIKLAFKERVNVKKVPASSLQLHKNLEVVTDKESAKLL